MNPVFSVVVLNYNRKDELRQTLTDVLAQEGLTPEVVVVDNASKDGSQAMVKAEFPSVRLMEMPENIGIRARRKAVDICSGKYVMLYDDDTSPASATDLAQLAAFFERKPEASVVLTAVYRTRSDYFETWSLENYAIAGDKKDGYEGLYLFGAGTAYRREHLLKTDAFNNDLFWGDEEFEAALNFLAHGYRLFYWPVVMTDHRASFVNRNKGLYYRRVTRNHLLTFLKYFDTPQVVEYSLKEVLYASVLARFSFPHVFLGAWDAFKLARKARAGRLHIDPAFKPYLDKELGEHRYPGPFKWFRQQAALKMNRKVKVF